MPIKRIALFVLLGIILILLLIELVSLYHDVRQLSDENNVLEEKLTTFQNENEQIKHDMTYYQDPENLEKSFREKFNYKKPGETMIIVVPQQTN